LKLYIKYMVSIRCKLVVKEELKKIGLHHLAINLGEVEIMENITAAQREQFRTALLRSGLELMDDKKAILVEKIKNVIVELIHYSDEELKVNFSDHLSEILQYDYTYLSGLFSEIHGTTIEQFIIHHKVERVKELIIYDELNLSEIAYKLHYSSVQHLSKQFKKVTGLSPTFFKHLKQKKRTSLESM
jgi:AraC-like DNA-binding protein